VKARILQQLEAELDAQGLKRNTPAYERKYRARKVELCKEFQRVESCWDCKAFDNCSLVKQHLVDLRTPRRKTA
jgi:hypothetical protein